MQTVFEVLGFGLIIGFTNQEIMSSSTSQNVFHVFEKNGCIILISHSSNFEKEKVVHMSMRIT